MIPHEPSIVKLCRLPSRWKNRSASLFLAQKPPTLKAAIRKFGFSLLPGSQNHGDVFTEVSKGRDYGVGPVENSTEGVVTHTLDMLWIVS